MSIAENLSTIHAEIKAAQSRSPRAAEQITLVAVTKMHNAAEIGQVIAAGQIILGENRVQELCEKYPAVSSEAQWHLIGHLQQNKVKYIIDKVSLIHSLESDALAKEIDKRAAALGIVMDCLVQVNIAEESSKFGLRQAEVAPFLERMTQYAHLRIRGLMNIAPNYADKEMARADFRAMRQLFDALSAGKWPNVTMDYLSMGMSGDYTIAVEEGANMLRIGSKIFAK